MKQAETCGPNGRPDSERGTYHLSVQHLLTGQCAHRARYRRFSESGGLSPTRTESQILGNVRVAGDSTGTENFRTERLDERLGGSVNSTAFPTTSAFVVTYPCGLQDEAHLL
jgi:hypothetical protein